MDKCGGLLIWQVYDIMDKCGLDFATLWCN